MGIVLVMALFLPSVLAVGVAPASSEHRSLIDNTFEYRFKVLNPDGEPAVATLSVEGNLAPYIALSEQQVQFRKGETEHWVTAGLTVSEQLQPGLHESRILVSSAPTLTGTFTATLQVPYRLSLFVDYPDFYVKADVLIPGFEVGKEGVFELQARNKGKNPVDAGIDAEVRVPGTTAAEALPSPGLSLAVGQYSTISLPWTPEWPGDYEFNAEISYASRTTNLSSPFMVGTPLLTPESAEIRRVALGEVLPITLGITSNWNVPIEAVHAWVEVWQNETLLLQTRTVSEDIPPRGQIGLPIYIETAGLEYGTYRMEMDLVSDRTRSHYAFELALSPKEIALTPTGFVITVKQITLSERLGQQWAFALAAVVLVAFVVFGSVMKRRTRKD